MGKKICVVFPGIGYHTDKPLLYYSKKYMMAHGYDIIDVTLASFRDIFQRRYKRYLMMAGIKR